MRLASTMPSAVVMRASRNKEPSSPSTLATVRSTPTSGASAMSTSTLGQRDASTANRLAEHERAARHRRDEHLSHETELAVPDDRDRGIQRRGDHRHREHTGEDVLLVGDAADAVVTDELREPGAQHEQEDERLDEAADDAGRHAAQADEIAQGDDPDRAQAMPQRRPPACAGPLGDGRGRSGVDRHGALNDRGGRAPSGSRRAGRAARRPASRARCT